MTADNAWPIVQYQDNINKALFLTAMTFGAIAIVLGYDIFLHATVAF